MGLKAKLITAGLVSIMLLGLSGVIYYLYQENAQLVTDKTQAIQLATQRQLTIDTMEQKRRTQDAALKALAQRNQALRQEGAARSDLIRRLQRENEDYRNWANTRLPDTVVRLRKRPAITGSSAYRDWLSNANSLRPDSQQPDNERRPAQ